MYNEIMDSIMPFLLQLGTLKPHFNLLDAIILIVVFFYVYEGYKLGFILAALDLAGFVLAFIIALKFYAVLANLSITLFSMPLGFANALAFFLTAIVSETVIQILLRRAVRYLPSLPKVSTPYRVFKNIDHTLGIVPGFISAFIILSFFLSILVALPSSPLVKDLATGSEIGGKLLANTSLLEKYLNTVFGGTLNETLNFLTVRPKSDESIALHFKVENGTVDERAEVQMFKLLNTERARSGLQLLASDDDLRAVGRAHAKDMLMRGYFSHYTPEGLSPFDRMDKAGLKYSFAGENLAFAPSTEFAMTGLMNSPEHRENILNPNYTKIGIGVIDAGIYGKMYSQEFSD